MIHPVRRSLDWIARNAGIVPEGLLCIAIPLLRGYALAQPGNTYELSPQIYKFLGDVPDDLNGILLMIAGALYLILCAIGKAWPRAHRPLLMVRLLSSGAFMGYYATTGMAMHRAAPTGGAWPWYQAGAVVVALGMIRAFVAYFGEFDKTNANRRKSDALKRAPMPPPSPNGIYKGATIDELRKLNLMPPNIPAR